MVSLLPLFFLYQIYRDISKKKARRRELTKYFKASGKGNGTLKDAVKLVDDLDSIVPGARQAAIRRIVKNDTKGVETIITVLDVPYYRSRIKGFVLTQPEFNGTIMIELYPFLLRALAEIGRSSVQKLKGALQHPNLNVRLSGMAALGETKNPAAIRLLAPFLDSTDVEERVGAIVALGELHAKPAAEKIIASLRDSEARVREIGIRALMKINDVRALPALQDLARTDQTVIDDRPIYTMKDLAEDAIRQIQKNNPVR
jgi:HEAT repeat protein